ncbi:hypothetical protein OG598_24955 [Micromonospora sp. NBC_00330]|uniref:hypothetical protein n=1 Tax=Micromonospora sp. NBC_00330 TaxID=2903585 RepID=UPI002E27D2EB|nr:hypothetical protein [Micromonospora sp. NBC_00330]
MARFEINQNALNRIGRQAVDNFNNEMQPVLDSVFEEYGGQLVDVVKEALATRWRAAGGEPLGEPRLSEWASVISQGQRLVLRNAG